MAHSEQRSEVNIQAETCDAPDTLQRLRPLLRAGKLQRYVSTALRHR